MADLKLIDSGRSSRGWSFYADLLHCPQKFAWRRLRERELHGTSALEVLAPAKPGLTSPLTGQPVDTATLSDRDVSIAFGLPADRAWLPDEFKAALTKLEQADGQPITDRWLAYHSHNAAFKTCGSSGHKTVKLPIVEPLFENNETDEDEDDSVFGATYNLEAAINIPATTRGSILHVALAHHYIGKTKEKDLYYSPVQAIEIMCDRMGATSIKGQLIEIYEAYLATYESPDRKYTVVEIEAEHGVTLKDGVRITSRFDLVLRDYKGMYYIFDHKTTKYVNKSLSSRYMLSGQFQLQWLLGEMLWGNKFGGIIINGVQSTTDDSGKITFLRLTLPSAYGMRKHFQDNIIWANQLLELLKDRELTDYPRAMNEQVCLTKYGKCPYFDKCQNN